MSIAEEFNKLRDPEKAQACLDLLHDHPKALGILRQSIMHSVWCRELASEIEESGANEAASWAGFLLNVIDTMVGLQLLYGRSGARIQTILEADPLWLAQKNRNKPDERDN